MISARKTYPTSCPFCHTAGETISKAAASAGVCCGSAECMFAYNAQASAAIEARRAEQAAARKGPVIAGEWGMAVLLSQTSG